MSEDTEAYFNRILRSVTVTGSRPGDLERRWSSFMLEDSSLCAYVIPVDGKPKLTAGEWFHASMEIARLLAEDDKYYRI